MGIFDRIREGLKKTRDAVVDQTVAVFQPGHTLTEEDYETLETALLRADVGPAATGRVLEGARGRRRRRRTGPWPGAATARASRRPSPSSRLATRARGTACCSSPATRSARRARTSSRCGPIGWESTTTARPRGPIPRRSPTT